MAEVVVLGGSLAGMAAAARLAKVGHRVRLLEPGEQLGPAAIPQVFTLPAAWRDLFRKSGRTLDAELARHELALSAVASRRTHGFDLPCERGAQYAAVSSAFGEPVAAAWRDLLDRLDTVWEAARWLGIELEFDPARLPEAQPALLWHRSVEDLARAIDHPVLSAIVRDTAAEPRRTPARAAMWLAVERTFGLWQLTDTSGTPTPSVRLVDLLAERLDQRKVEVSLNHPLPKAAGVDADAVVYATGPRRNPAPWRRDRNPAPWRRDRNKAWLALPGSRLGGRYYTCGAHTKAGTGVAEQLLSGALVAYAVHADVTGENIHPTNTKQSRTR